MFGYQLHYEFYGINTGNYTGKTKVNSIYQSVNMILPTTQQEQTMQTLTKTIEAYTLQELKDQFPDGFKQAHQDWMEHNLDYDWWDCVYDDFTEICALIGVEVKNIHFSGFWSQGDGAAFDGDYYYRKGAAKDIRSHAPLDTELHRIADTLQQVQRKYFYWLAATIKQSFRGFNLSVDVINMEHPNSCLDDDAEDAVRDCITDLAHWLYKTLEREYEYLQSEESFLESCQDAEVLFTEDGELVY